MTSESINVYMTTNLVYVVHVRFVEKCPLNLEQRLYITNDLTMSS
jgi:hypothetical protein